ncbi:GPR1/FUN34/yaaH family-domain-containing protein [Hypoxylon trugodes]|uniref:GPR1/FUN34/yaaH family-domain-containing protein n=1 Tax=Hypoxylon trugodes TaxID=326681 RepID=UPI002192F6BA|nr:GPR1/FUN34/yaaH family-domain-containing protein [Hypoxylon trugodes]KAI1384013.1 GPR1/FUN34/yaaH family-domain-containing protein [Hypoxylon trugodes]
MASNELHQEVPAAEKGIGAGAPAATTGVNNTNGLTATQRYDYGGNPLYHAHSGPDERLPAFGGEFQPGLYKSIQHRKFANPAPLGLSAFALTTFVLSLVNVGARDITAQNIALSLAYGYGGLVQLLAGMWEMAVGNTFGATALSSYGGFWISFAIVLTPGFDVLGDYTTDADKASVLGFFLIGWFIFTFILLLCTLRSTVMFFLLFLTLDLAFLMLACGEFAKSNGATSSGTKLGQAGGVFGLLAAFLAWYNAFAGIADSSNSFFIIPVFHFPWSEKGREARAKSERETA